LRVLVTINFKDHVGWCKVYSVMRSAQCMMCNVWCKELTSDRWGFKILEKRSKII